MGRGGTRQRSFSGQVGGFPGRELRQTLPVTVTFEQSKWIKELSHVEIRRESIPVSGKNQCKDRGREEFGDFEESQQGARGGGVQRGSLTQAGRFASSRKEWLS